jgi:hypothetical protein
VSNKQSAATFFRYLLNARDSPVFLRAHQHGGGERDRTDDLLLAKQALSQLSYTPSGTCTLNDRNQAGGSGWARTNDPRLIKTVL